MEHSVLSQATQSADHCVTKGSRGREQRSIPCKQQRDRP